MRSCSDERTDGRGDVAAAAAAAACGSRVGETSRSRSRLCSRSVCCAHRASGGMKAIETPRVVERPCSIMSVR